VTWRGAPATWRGKRTPATRGWPCSTCARRCWGRARARGAAAGAASPSRTPFPLASPGPNSSAGEGRGPLGQHRGPGVSGAHQGPARGGPGVPRRHAARGTPWVPAAAQGRGGAHRASRVEGEGQCRAGASAAQGGHHACPSGPGMRAVYRGLVARRQGWRQKQGKEEEGEEGARVQGGTGGGACLGRWRNR